MLTREELEQEKLRLEIEALNKRFTSTPTFWFGLVSVIVAVVGVIAQSYLSRIESEKAELLTEQSKKQLAEIQQKRDFTQKQIDSNRLQIDILKAEKANLTKQTSNLIAAVQQKSPDSGGANQAKENSDIRKAVSSASNSLFSVALYGYKVDETSFDTAKNYLTRQGYSLVTNQILPSRPSWLSSVPVVLFYDDKTAPTAKSIAEALTAATGKKFTYLKGHGVGLEKGSEQTTLKIHFVL